MRPVLTVLAAIGVTFVGLACEAKPPPRVATAYGNELANAQATFREAGATWPPRRLLLRGFKHDAELEVWAGRDATGPLVRVRTMPICANSGVLGPKRREGDLQVPEGFYEISGFNPASSFWLSMRVSYPNASDRVRGGPRLGGDIMVHGRCVTIGCLPMTDPGIEWLYVVAWEARQAGQRSIPIHLFPARFDRHAAVLAKHAEADPALAAFWDELRVGFDRFEQTKVPPKYRVARDGRYLFE